jgi:hypothetical protein
MSISTAPQRLFSPTFLQEALTQEVHRLLSLQYARPILEAMEAHADGVTTRWLDVHVVGDGGSAKTAYVVVRKFEQAGWVAPRKGPNGQLFVLTSRGQEALGLARRGDSIGNGGVGVRS